MSSQSGTAYKSDSNLVGPWSSEFSIFCTGLHNLAGHASRNMGSVMVHIGSDPYFSIWLWVDLARELGKGGGICRSCFERSSDVVHRVFRLGGT